MKPSSLLPLYKHRPFYPLWHTSSTVNSTCNFLLLVQVIYLNGSSRNIHLLCLTPFYLPPPTVRNVWYKSVYTRLYELTLEVKIFKFSVSSNFIETEISYIGIYHFLSECIIHTLSSFVNIQEFCPHIILVFTWILSVLITKSPLCDLKSCDLSFGITIDRNSSVSGSLYPLLDLIKLRYSRGPVSPPLQYFFSSPGFHTLNVVIHLPLILFWLFSKPLIISNYYSAFLKSQLTTLPSDECFLLSDSSTIPSVINGKIRIRTCPQVTQKVFDARHTIILSNLRLCL